MYKAWIWQRGESVSVLSFILSQVTWQHWQFHKHFRWRLLHLQVSVSSSGPFPWPYVPSLPMSVEPSMMVHQPGELLWAQITWLFSIQVLPLTDQPCDWAHACAGTSIRMAQGQEQTTGGEGRLPKPNSSRYVLSFSCATIITVICHRETLNPWKKIAV